MLDMGVKDDSDGVSEMRNVLSETRGNIILVVRQQRTWLNYALVFCRR